MKKSYPLSMIYLLTANLTFGQIFTPGSGVTDADGHTYSTIIIGGTEWMAENLRTSHYANGDPILNITSNSDWSPSFGNSEPGYCYYNNSSSNNASYGKLYNWFAVSDQRNICPSGWYVPDWADWSSLLLAIDPSADVYGLAPMSTTAGYKMKAESFSGSNASGFNALPAGRRSGGLGTFSDAGTHTYWWSRAANALDEILGEPAARWVYSSSQELLRSSYDRKSGYSVRCVKGSGTGVFNLNEVPIELYPNPSIDHVRFNVPVILIGADYQVFNPLGQCVLSGTIKEASTLLAVNELLPGIHILKIESSSIYWVRFSKL